MPPLGRTERELMVVIKALGGAANPERIARFMRVSEGYAERTCDDLVEKRHLVRLGRGFRLVTHWDGLEEDAKLLKDAVRGRFTLGVYEAPGLLVKAEAPGAVQDRVVHPASITRVRTIRDPGQPGDEGASGEQEQRAKGKKATEALEKFTPVRLDY